ncbi:pentapeptide repeat-containing protein [Phorcysia thermohydrogeniphila]|uniref:pentapeptide repeat-containing protein n=1 Tax=Phorcysia thermohydrogeniphila TaxID=936138 RepID=UPI00104D1A57|nr:pentapeptide repeat-containing protein [Phorcysia thermohydrogeniphila]
MDGEEGREFRECKVCRKLKRNVIEPVAVFLKDGQNLEDLTEEELRKFDTCIFHCEKENEVWMENVEEYKEWKKKRDETLRKGKDFKEKIEIKWNENLVDEFWRRVRAYRFAVDFVWESLLGCEGVEFTVEDLEKERKLVRFNLNNLLKSHGLCSYDYDFRYFIFPKFYIPEVSKDLKISREKPHLYFSRRSFNFWYEGEPLLFSKSSKFFGAIFLDKAEFKRVNFQEEAVFEKIVFQNEVDFSRSVFKDLTEFIEIVFKGKALFIRTLFNSEVEFRDIKFQDVVSFWDVTFERGVVFWRLSLTEAYVKAEGLALMFDDIRLSKDSYVEIRDSRIAKLVLKNVNNSSDNFCFFNIKLVKTDRENCEQGELIEPSIEIENSRLKGMELINCNFSEAKQIKIEDSSLTKVEFINVNWGKISEKRICRELFEKSPEKARDVYRQLKLALDNQKDYINANEFYSLEMKAYERALRKKLLPLQKKLVFSIHKFASDFGQSWLKPLLLIILLTTGEMGAKLAPSSFFSEFLYFLKSYIFIALFLSPLLVISEEWRNFSTLEWKKLSTFKELFSMLLTWLLYICLWEISIIFALSGFIVFNKFLPCFSFNPESWQLSLKVFLEEFAQTLNIFNFFKSSQVPSEKFLHTLYSIAVTFLTYQMIVAIRRQVRR